MLKVSVPEQLKASLWDLVCTLLFATTWLVACISKKSATEVAFGYLLGIPACVIVLAGLAPIFVWLGELNNQASDPDLPEWYRTKIVSTILRGMTVAYFLITLCYLYPNH